MNGVGDMEPGRPEPELRAQRSWGRRAQAIAAILWPSFLAAAIGTMLFFAYVDPADMQDALRLPSGTGRMTGYGLGFFFFWLITGISSAVSVYLLRTARRNPRNRDNGKG